ncbi:MAG: copper resistance protein B [Pseudomonadales bacterium]|nr:copper resistance protein B [Pseudomonadales bacterium]MCP5184919.1 copper resistance protein B [Pseudomonadales bacterium]
MSIRWVGMRIMVLFFLAGSGAVLAASPPAGSRDPHAWNDGYALHDDPLQADGVHGNPHPAQRFRGLRVERLESSVDKQGDGAAEFSAWWGGDWRRWSVNADLDQAPGEPLEGDAGLLYGVAVSPFWDVKGGLRRAWTSHGERTWMVIGMQGLAPYWFEINAELRFGESAGAGVNLEITYELLLTQRVVLQARGEANAWTGTDRQLASGRGISDGNVGLRLRYEFSRQFGLYAGVEHSTSWGTTARLRRDSGAHAKTTRWIGGLRFWF